MKTVVGLFDSFDDARGVVDEITGLGVARGSIKIENVAKGEHAFHTHGEAELGDASGSLIGGLVNAGLPKDDARYYAEGVRRGGTLILVMCDDNLAQRVYDLLGRHGSVDLDARMLEWKKSGWTGFGETTMEKKTTTRNELKGRELKQGETVIPVVEEELQVGKREVQKGGVRVYSHMTETPVQEQVNLREEHVRVERRPVDRAVNTSDVKAFKDQTIEMREKAEEVVVGKTARVIEEVIIGKEVSNRTETVRDTVRRTDVEVEKLQGERTTSLPKFETYTADFRNHWQTTYGKTSKSYDEYLPVYKYGYSLGTDDRFSTHKDWSSLEPDARRHWEERNPGTWEQFKDTIRYAWDKARGRR